MKVKLILIFALALSLFIACNRELTSNGEPGNAEEEKTAFYDNDASDAGSSYDEIKESGMNELEDREKFKDYFEKGMAAHNAGDFKSAIKFFTSSIEAYGEYADAWSFRGMSKFKADDTRGACSDWKHAHELGYAPAADLYDQYCR